MSAISSRLQSASGHREGGRVVGGGGEKELPENGQAVGERKRGRSEPEAPGAPGVVSLSTTAPFSY